MEKSYQNSEQKIYSGNISEKELNNFHNLFLLTENEYNVKGILLNHLMEFKGDVKNYPDFDKLFISIKRKIREENRNNVKPFKTFVLSKFARVAAVLLIGIIICALGYYLFNQKHDYTTLISANTASVAFSALPDGTQLYLNSGSQLSFNPSDWGKKRIVELKGEAWFEVEANKNKPFIVKTSYYDVHVTGTKFNVKAYEPDVEVTTTLDEGSVKIVSSDKLKLEHEITLEAGEQFIFDKESRGGIVKKVNASWFTSWKENKLIFVNMKLEEMCVLLERKYGVDIILKDKRLFDLHFNGTIKNETIIQVLEILRNTLPIEYKIVDQQIEIVNK